MEKTLIRIAEYDLEAKKRLMYALTKVKGIGFVLAKAICLKLGMDPMKKLSELNQEELKKLSEALKDLNRLGLPAWLLNRKKDEKGKDLHLLGPKLEFKVKEDMDRLKRIKSWKGIRHSLGLPVRGQKTRTTHRKGLMIKVHEKAEKEVQKT